MKTLDWFAGLFGYLHKDVLTAAEKDILALQRKLGAALDEQERLAKARDEQTNLKNSFKKANEGFQRSAFFITHAAVQGKGGTETKPAFYDLVVRVVHGAQARDVVIRSLAANKKNRDMLQQIADHLWKAN